MRRRVARWWLGWALALGPSAVAWGQPQAPAAPPPVVVVAATATPPAAAPPQWGVELLFAVQPDQTKDVTCSPQLDCLTPARTFFAGAVRGRYERPGSWWTALTLAVGRAEDQERWPASGYGVLTVRADLQVELGREVDRFGVALRVSPTLVLGWSGTGSGLRTDVPAFAFLLGLRDLWGEVGLPSIPTQVDPRQFYLQLGWRQPLFTLEGGFATFGSLGYRVDEIHKTGGGLGAWLSARGRLTATSPWEATLRVAIANPAILVIGVAYRGE